MFYSLTSPLNALSKRFFAWGISLSLSLHLLLMVGAFLFDEINFGASDRKRQPIEVQLVERAPILPTQETLQETATQAPDQAAFASSRNLRTEKETSPEASRSNVISGPRQQAKAQEQPERKSFSLSQEELVAMNDPLLSDAPDVLGEFSPGFVERLEKGAELKINAFGFDYGQYLERMKRKIAQRWNPRSTIVAEMYDYSEITVQLAVVLDEYGELLNLAIIETSFFPEFDQEAIRSIEDSVPFPNPPDSLIQDDGKVYIPWYFRMSFRQNAAGVY